MAIKLTGASKILGRMFLNRNRDAAAMDYGTTFSNYSYAGAIPSNTYISWLHYGKLTNLTIAGGGKYYYVMYEHNSTTYTGSNVYNNVSYTMGTANDFSTNAVSSGLFSSATTKTTNFNFVEFEGTNYVMRGTDIGTGAIWTVGVDGFFVYDANTIQIDNIHDVDNDGGIYPPFLFPETNRRATHWARNGTAWLVITDTEVNFHDLSAVVNYDREYRTANLYPDLTVEDRDSMMVITGTLDNTVYNMYSGFFNPEGKRLIYSVEGTEANGGGVYELPLDTAWDLSTAGTPVKISLPDIPSNFTFTGVQSTEYWDGFSIAGYLDAETPAAYVYEATPGTYTGLE